MDDDSPLLSGLWQRLTRRTLSLANSLRGSTTESKASIPIADGETLTDAKIEMSRRIEQRVVTKTGTKHHLTPFIEQAPRLPIGAVQSEIGGSMNRRSDKITGNKIIGGEPSLVVSHFPVTKILSQL